MRPILLHPALSWGRLGTVSAPEALISIAPDPASPLLVCVHGWLLSGRLWQPLLDRLQPRWEVWAPDLPGFGTEPRPRGLQPSLISYGRWLADAARERAGGRSLVLIGHSLGGSLVLHAAPQLGEQLLGVVQVAAGGGVYQPRPFRLVRRGGAGFLRWRPGWLAQVPGTEAIRSPLRAELRAARSLLACSMQRGAVRQLPALAAALPVPSLWISGSRDTVMEPRYVRHLAGYCQQQRVVELAGQGHLPMRTAPAALASAIEAWLQKDLGLGEPGLDPDAGAQRLASPRSWSSASCA